MRVSWPYSGARLTLEREGPRLFARLVPGLFNVSVSRIAQVIHAAALPPDIAGLLKMPPGTAGLWINRQYRDGSGNLIEMAWSVHPAERFSYRMVLDRTWRSARQSQPDG